MNTPVNFELAKLLKEKGFDKPVKQRYFIAENIDSDRFPFLQEECALHNWNDYDDSSTSYYSAPTIAEVVMWLYEKHGIWVYCEINKDKFYTKAKKLKSNWRRVVSGIKNNEIITYNSPTEAYEFQYPNWFSKK